MSSSYERYILRMKTANSGIVEERKKQAKQQIIAAFETADGYQLSKRLVRDNGWDENYEYCTIVKTNLFVQSELTPARTITISSYFNDAVPNRGYSFVDQYGELHEFECQIDMIG